MEYLIDLKFEDKGYNAIVHFVATFTCKDANEAKAFVDELVAGFNRREVFAIIPPNYYRIDDDPLLKQRSYEYYDFCRKRATASIDIEQFILKEPDQHKSLIQNLTERLFNGKDSTARLGNEYKIPVRVIEKGTRSPIASDIYYFSIEHLIPQK